MKRRLQYTVKDCQVEKEINYIPVRYIIAVMLTAFEVAAVIGIVLALCCYVPYFYLAAWATEIGCIIRIIASDDNPDYKVPWLLFVLIIPVAGFMLYFMFYSRTLQKRFIKRLDALKALGYERNDSELFKKLRNENPAAAGQAKMLCEISESSLFENTRQQYFPLGEDMFAALIGDLKGAEKFIYMEYFIIEEGVFWNSILEILKEKAAAGVDVRIVVPHIPDKKLVFAMTRSFYPRLMAAGVKIYEYTPGFIHAKSYLADDQYAMIGTINLDYRSLVHHFENGVWMYKCDCLPDLKADMEEVFKKSIAVDESMLKTNLLQRIIRSVVRVFAPML